MNVEKIENTIKKFKDHTILVIGDLMIDEYIIGKTERISPEAPVPIVEIEREFSRLGGSGNVISNIISLGGNVIPCGVIGNDSSGDFITEELKKICAINKNSQFFLDGVIVDHNRPTTRKTRIFSDNQQMLRVDKESKKELNEDLVKYIDNFIYCTQNQYSAIIISDYQKGLLNYDLTQRIIKFGRENNKLVFVDPKGSYEKYKGANFITPNLKELSMATGLIVETDDQIYDAGMKLYNDLNIDGLIVTRGKDGISVIRNDGHKMVTLPTMDKEVFDVVGCGDTVIATFALSYLSRLSMKSSAIIANLTGGIVATKIGTATTTLEEILRMI